MKVNTLRMWMKKEPVLCISALCAAATMLLVPPSRAYAGYIDVRVLCLLFCLMAVVAGFQSCGTFDALASVLLKRCQNARALGLVPVLLPFFCSMMITNDVALITFVPFTLLLTASLNLGSRVIPLLVLQTIAANLGSMATPVGNPQNLYLYTAYNLTAGDFFKTLLPFTAFSLAVLSAGAWFCLPSDLKPAKTDTAVLKEKRSFGVYCILFICCLMTVFRILPYQWLMAGIVIILLFLKPQLLKAPDYGLLATFVCFFIISGNLSEMEALQKGMEILLAKNSVMTSAAASQVISNVPAAVLLSGFTKDWEGLLIGTNLGGLGTLVASLASLITLKYYMSEKNAQVARYILWFTVMNFAMLAVMLILTGILI